MEECVEQKQRLRQERVSSVGNGQCGQSIVTKGGVVENDGGRWALGPRIK